MGLLGPLRGFKGGGGWRKGAKLQPWFPRPSSYLVVVARLVGVHAVGQVNNLGLLAEVKHAKVESRHEHELDAEHVVL